MTRQNPNGVDISREVFEGLEFIRQSGSTNMLDRPMVLQLAREWGYDATAEWIESADRKTYGELIFKGPNVIEEEEEYIDASYEQEQEAYDYAMYEEHRHE